MKLTNTPGSLSIRRNTQMRSLVMEYPRIDNQEDILAGLFNLHNVDLKIDLPVVTSDAKGIEFKIPSFLSGIFYLKIQDGDASFLRKIAIQ